MAERIDPCARSRCRLRDVPDMGEVWVPRHIVRLDSPKLAGWQVRFERPWTYFPDAEHGGVDRSFAAAKRLLRRQWRPVAWRTSRRASAGVRLINDARGVWYVEATHPLGRPPRRFYVGTDATRTQTREREARRLARAQRATWLAEHKEPLR